MWYELNYIERLNAFVCYSLGECILFKELNHYKFRIFINFSYYSVNQINFHFIQYWIERISQIFALPKNLIKQQIDAVANSNLLQFWDIDGTIFNLSGSDQTTVDRNNSLFFISYPNRRNKLNFYYPKRKILFHAPNLYQSHCGPVGDGFGKFSLFYNLSTRLDKFVYILYSYISIL